MNGQEHWYIAVANPRSTIMARYISEIILLCLILLSLPGHVMAEGHTVVPEAEREVARNMNEEGPSETHGIKSSELLGSIGLGSDFPELQGQSLRVRRVTLKSGGVVGVHQHTRRPGVLYMLEGELVEVRNDSNSSIKRDIGDVSFEQGGVIHWWRNDSGADAKALVVDIVPESIN